MTTTLLDHALGYADRGWRVFVLSASKKPLRNCDACADEHTTPDLMESCDCLTCHGFYAATLAPDRINEMLSTHPLGCLAIRTGSTSGLAVVDFDFRIWHGDHPANSDPAWRTMCSLDEQRLLPGTVMAETGNGGLHMLYAHPGDGYLMSGAAKYGLGVDSKADGGYIVAAPSATASGKRYRWLPGSEDWRHKLTPLPDELAARLRPPVPAPAVKAVVAPWTRPEQAGARLAGLVRTVLEGAEGERNDRLHWAAKKAGAMVAAGEVDEATAVAVLTDAGVAVGLSASEIGDAGRGTIASGLRKGRVAA